ncbi:hypothetical protein GO496_16270 [Acidovorax citrulli]|nr:hypothetical protein [Paracidovorax citrulli]
MKEGDKALFVVGGGTAALTYLSTVDLDSRFTHVVVVGDQGYWNRVGHRLAQPHHILALPHEDSAGFVDPGRHDALRRILPHDDRSAYVHSRDYQARLARLGQYTRGLLESQGRKVLFAGGVSVGKITKSDGAGYRIATNAAGPAVVGHKVVIATGAAPARSLANHLLPDKSTRDLPHILGYDDILAPGAAERIQGKSVMVYGGGPTAAWAMEVAKGHAGSSMWVARNGFGVAEAAGPRVGGDHRRQPRLPDPGRDRSHPAPGFRRSRRGAKASCGRGERDIREGRGKEIGGCRLPCEFHRAGCLCPGRAP